MTVEELFNRWHDEVLVVQVSPNAAELQVHRGQPHHPHARQAEGGGPQGGRHQPVGRRQDEVGTRQQHRGTYPVRSRPGLTEAVNWEVVPRNVGLNTKPPRINYAEKRTLTPEQARDFMEAAAENRYGTLFMTMVTLGLRKAEACGLAWRALTSRPGFCRSVTRRSTNRLRAQTRSVSNSRTPRRRRASRPQHPPQLVTLLKAHELERSGSGWPWPLMGGHGPGVHPDNGELINPNNLNHHFDSICTDAGLGHWTPHELRHSAASPWGRWCTSGGGIKRLGHASIRITADTYQHIMAPQQQAAAAAIASTIWGKCPRRVVTGNRSHLFAKKRRGASNGGGFPDMS